MKGFILVLAVCLGVSIFSQTVNAQCRPCMGCGNGKCEMGENCQTCPGDCGLCPTCANRCGNNICEAALGENACNCPKDCGPCCVDAICREDKGETFANCPADCGVLLQTRPVDAETGKNLVGSLVTCRDQLGVGYGTQSSGVDGIASFVVPGGRYNCTATNDPTYWANTVTVMFFPISSPQVFPIPLRFKWGCITGDVYNLVTLERLPGVTVSCTSSVLNTTTHLTGTMGQYHFDRLLPGTYTCTGNLATFAAGVGTVTVLPGGYCPRLDLYLRPLPGRVEGYTTDSKQNQLNGVNISCYVQTNPLLRNNAVTAGPGYYRIDNFDSGYVTCQATLTGYTPQSKFGFVPRGGVLQLNFTLALLPASLTGFVYDTASPNALFGATVNCNTGTLSGQTQNNGFYSFLSIDPSSYTCIASKSGYASSSSQSISLAPGQAGSLNFTLVSLPSVINVRVTDSVSLAGVQGATVNCSFTNNAGTPFFTGSTNGNGDMSPSYNFNINDPNAITYGFSCSASAPGFGSASSSLFTIGRGQTVNVSLVLVFLGINVTVRELTTAGSAVVLQGASVICTSGPSNILTATTPVNGAVSFPGVLPGNYNCSATKAGYTYDSQAFALTVSSGVVSVNLLIQVPVYTIEGVINDIYNTTAPIPGLTLQVTRVPDGVVIATVTPNGVKFGRSTAWAFNTTLPVNVTYFVSGPSIVLPSSTSQFTYTVANYRSPSNPARYPTIIPLTYSSSTIQGKITNANTGGLVSSSVAVLATSGNGGSQFAGVYDNTTGNYVIASLADGSYVVSFTADGFGLQSVNVTVARLGLVVQQNVALVPPTTGSVSGTITDNLGNLLNNASIQLTVGSTVLTTTSANGGSWSFSNVPPGNATITGSSGNFRNAVLSVVVQAGLTITNQKLALGLKGGSVSGTVYKVSGSNQTPLTSAVQICVFKQGYSTPTTPNNPNCAANPAYVASATIPQVGLGAGQYAIDNIPEGTYYLYADASAAGIVKATAVTTPLVILESTPQRGFDILMPSA